MKKLSFLTILLTIIFLPGCGTTTTVPAKQADEVAIPIEAITTQEETKPANIIKEKPMEEVNKEVAYTAVLHTTEGDITIKLNDDQTPKTVENFVTLAKKDFYSDVIFHRIIKGFMIQGGDPTGTGSGGPGYKFDDEKFTGEYTRGTVAMANAGPNTNGSQFFIMHADMALPKAYTIFGHVTDGMDTVDKIAEAAVISGGEGSSPVEPVKIVSVDISEE